MRYGLEEPQTRYVADLACVPATWCGFSLACLVTSGSPLACRGTITCGSSSRPTAFSPRIARLTCGLVRQGLLERSVSPDPLGGLRSRRARPKRFPLKKHFTSGKVPHDRRTRFDSSHNRAIAANDPMIYRPTRGRPSCYRDSIVAVADVARGPVSVDDFVALPRVAARSLAARKRTRRMRPTTSR